MAKTSDNIRPCNIGQSEAHNRRTPQYLSYINKENIYLRTDLMKDNEVWVSPRIEGVSLREYYKYLGEMVKTKTGRAMQTKDRTRLNKKTGRTSLCAAVHLSRKVSWSARQTRRWNSCDDTESYAASVGALPRCKSSSTATRGTTEYPMTKPHGSRTTMLISYGTG